MSEINYKYKNKFDNIKRNDNKFNFIITLVVLAVLLFSAAYIYVLFKNEKKEIENHIAEVAYQIVSSIHYRISNNFQELNTLSVVLKSVKPSKLNVQNLLKLFLAEMPTNNFISMGYINAEGIKYEITKGGKALAPVKIVDDVCYKEMLSGNICISATSKNNDNVNRFNYYYPIIDAKNKFIGGLCGTGNARNFIDSMNIVSFNDTAEIYIVSSNGGFVFSVNPEDNIENFNLIFNEIQKKRVTSNLKPDSLVDTGFIWFKDEQNILKIANFTPIEYNGWNILLIVPENSLSKSNDKLVVFTILFFVFINALIAIILNRHYKIQKEHDAKILQLAFFDEVTGTYTKTKFTIESNKMLTKYKSGDNFSMIVMDIENFKVVNDVYDMHKGNEVLKDIASIIKDKSDKKGVCGRLNSDVFAILLHYKNENEIFKFTDEIIEELSKYPLSVKLVPSFGIYYIKEHLPIELMCDRAIMAKRMIKGQAGIRYAVFSENLRDRLLSDKAIEDEMHKALEEKQFVMYLQPKYDMQTGNPCGAEALVRWIHPEKSLIPPLKFIPLFEKNGFVAQIDKYIWEQAAITVRKWIDSGMTPIPISVNVSRIHFNNPDLIKIITGIVEKHNVSSKYLELEITEGAFLENTETMNNTILSLKEKGFEIAMDDFGTGYSSLNMLRCLPVDYLKLDRGFINETTCSERGLTVLRYIVKMAKHLKTKVISEGIETLEQSNLLKELGCDIAQGFYYAKPMPLDEFEQKVFGHVIEENIGVKNE